MLIAAVGLGAVGTLPAIVVGKVTSSTVGVMRRLDARPLLRGAIGGLAVGMIAYALPLTLFSGQSALPIILDEFESLGVLMLLSLALFKALALGVSLGCPDPPVDGSADCNPHPVES